MVSLVLYVATDFNDFYKFAVNVAIGMVVVVAVSKFTEATPHGSFSFSPPSDLKSYRALSAGGSRRLGLFLHNNKAAGTVGPSAHPLHRMYTPSRPSCLSVVGLISLCRSSRQEGDCK
jgi:hypothetical protein